jgi:hypothetical protein
MDGGVITKERALAFEGFIDELIDENQIAGGDVLSKRAYGTAAYQGVDAELFEGKDIGCKRDIAGRKFMALAVSIQECDFVFPQRADHDSRTRLSKRRFDIVRLGIGNLFVQGVAQAGSTYDTNDFFCHWLNSLR